MELPVRAAQTHSLMDLYAAGLNAWDQLIFNPPTAGEEPDDIFSFTKVLGAQSIGRIAAHMCFTAVKLDNNWSVAGASPSFYKEEEKECLFEYPSAISADGKIVTAESRKPITSSDQPQAIVQYSSLAAWKGNRSTYSWPCSSRIRRIASYNAGFVILHEDASVSILGDPRFADCLGRDVDESRYGHPVTGRTMANSTFSPAHVPNLVPDLNDLGEPVKKVAAGGYTVAALTEGGGLYIWGADPTGSHILHQVFPGLSGIPNYVEVDGDKDVQDIALGESHAIALTTDGCVYVVGDNTNGQLGLGKDLKDPVESWLRIDFKVPLEREIVGVEAGPRSSFIITAKANSE
ncbi:hypothetical protein FZEAL_7139 [Fusarium zealandicum]|uniref:Uncharacterized protein n=1 Tax=Fusarium zealandicum TaxID=1053134 RepID=A0A8H4UGJ7_9HYPO|nr:hypothetical protein FZEAL_7139 [Fusarium zealandicum]